MYSACFLCIRASPFLVWYKSLIFLSSDSAYPRHSGLFTHLSWTPFWLMTFHPGSALASSHLHYPKCFPYGISPATVQCLSSLTCSVGTDVWPLSYPKAYMAILWEAFGGLGFGCTFAADFWSLAAIVGNCWQLTFPFWQGNMGESAYTACFVLDQVLSCV